MPNQLTLHRTSLGPEETIGILYLNDDPIALTLEPAWRNNAPSISCIPPGDYDLAHRRSARQEVEPALWSYAPG